MSPTDEDYNKVTYLSYLIVKMMKTIIMINIIRIIIANGTISATVSATLSPLALSLAAIDTS